MAEESLCFLSIHELGQTLQKRDASPVDVVQAYLARCERLNPSLNTFVTVAAERALAAAHQAEQEIAAGHYRGPLHGVPVAVKDIFDTAGIRTTHGSSFYRDNVPEEDAACIALLKQAGAIILGKCNTHEFAAGSTTNNPWYGASHNPWDLQRSPGGSSGGSGAAVAAFLCSGATGSDTGGSIRNPAACNGIVGLKPTYGCVSLQGIHPMALSLDHPGPLTRTVQDAGLLLQGMAGYVQDDPTSINLPLPDYMERLEAGVQGMRLAFCPDLYFTEVDDAVASGLEEAAQVLQAQGAGLETISFELKDVVEETRWAIMGAEFATLHRERFEQHPEGYGEDVQARLRKAMAVSVDDYIHACQHRLAIRRAFETLFQEVDALLLPSSPCVAPLIEDGTSTINGEVVDFGAAGVPLRQPINVAGLPALAVPIGFSNGLPISMQIVGPAWHEAEILRIGYAYEMTTPSLRGQRPPYG